MNTNYYKLIDTSTGESLDDNVYTLTQSEAIIINYAYSLNGTSKKMELMELME